MIIVDKSGKALRPAFVWLDQRNQAKLNMMSPGWEVLLGLARERQTVKYFRSEAEANWIQNQQPEIWKNTHRYLLLSGFHTFKLTGKFELRHNGNRQHYQQKICRSTSSHPTLPCCDA